MERAAFWDGDTLRDHGLRWRFNFLAAIHDYDPEPKWAERDLSSAHRAELEALIAQHRVERPQDDPQMVRAGNMEHNGIECSHLHGTSLLNEKVPTAGFHCHTCDAYIVPTVRPETFRFIGGPLDGYYLATGGLPVWFAPLPVPVSAVTVADLPNFDPLPCAEYERRQNVYVLRG